MNILHDINPKCVTAEKFTAVVEIPMGSNMKYEIDKESGLIKLDRVLKTSMFYTGNYGFIPRTLSEDGDALDVIVMMDAPVAPMTLIDCKPVAVIKMVDNGEADEKIVAVPTFVSNDEICESKIKQFAHFLRNYKALQNDSKVEVKDPEGKEEAIKIIKEAMALYNKKGAKK